MSEGLTRYPFLPLVGNRGLKILVRTVRGLRSARPRKLGLPRFSVRARRTISSGSNEVYFSAVSAWEIAIKVSLGRLQIGNGNIEQFIAEQVAVNGFRVLAIELSHAPKTASLPSHHRDPFDPLLIA